jgi:hypothetical protein
VPLVKGSWHHAFEGITISRQLEVEAYIGSMAVLLECISYRSMAGSRAAFSASQHRSGVDR